MRIGTGIMLAAASAAWTLTSVMAATAAPLRAPRAQSWHVAFTVAGPNLPEFTAVTATSGTSAWAFFEAGGKAPGAYQLSGSHWTTRPFPSKSGDTVVSASSSSASNVWAFTFKGQALRYDGGNWAVMKSFGKVIGSGLAISGSNVWVFGAAFTTALGTWHYNGSTWTRSTSGAGLYGASALSPSNIWAYGATSVAHWNGRTWTKTSVAGLLPKNTLLSHSFVAGIYAAASNNVYAIASGGRQDEGGPFVLLHYNGASWHRIALVKKLGGPVAVVPDGSGGLWMPVVTGFPGNASMEHYAHGTLSSVGLPYTPPHLLIFAAANGRHTTAALTVGYYRKSFSASTTKAVILRYGS